MRKYETIFIINSTIDDEARIHLIDRFVNLIKENANLEKLEEWGNKHLAYEIQKFRDGYYVYVSYEANPDFPKEFERNLRITDGVIRYMTTLLR